MIDKNNDVKLSCICLNDMNYAGYTPDRWFSAWHNLTKKRQSNFLLVERSEDPENWFDSGISELISKSDIKKCYISYPAYHITVCCKDGKEYYINTPHGTLTEAKYAMMCISEIFSETK